MNAYKEAWLAEVMFDYSQKRAVSKKVAKLQKARGRISARGVADQAAKQKAQATILKGAHQASKYAAKSQLKGTIGIALRVGGRIGLRAIPVVGVAMLAYDLYQLGEHLLE